MRLRYLPDELLVSVADDGEGDPARLRRLLALERCMPADGRHRGLANIEARITDLGGAVAFRRARIGGVRVELRIPLPIAPAVRPATISGLVGAAAAVGGAVDRAGPVHRAPPANSPERPTSRPSAPADVPSAPPTPSSQEVS